MVRMQLTNFVQIISPVPIYIYIKLRQRVFFFSYYRLKFDNIGGGDAKWGLIDIICSVIA